VVEVGARLESDESSADLRVESGADSGSAADRIIAEMKARDLLAAAIGGRQQFQYASYSI
jgi:hypothetical protein